MIAAIAAWVLAFTGAAVWAAAAVWVLAVFVEPHSSNRITYGCARCEWEVGNPRARRWWTLHPQYRWHCVTAHHDWPPLYRHRQADTTRR